MPLRNAKSPEKKVQLFETLLGAGSWTFDLRTQEVTWSAGLYHLVGLDPHAVVADFNLYQSLVHPDDHLANAELLSLASANRLSVRRFRIIRPDGHLIWLESTFEAQYDRDGKLGILHGVVQDVTAIQQATLEQRHTASLNSSMRKLLGGDFWRADPSGKLLDLTNWMRFTGLNEVELRNYDALEPIHPDDRQIFLETWAAAIAAKHRVDLRVRVRRHDGIYVLFQNSAVPVLDGDGEIVEWHGVSQPLAQRTPDCERARTITSRHIRAARALLDWTAPDLAELSGVSFSTIRRMEVDTDSVKPERIKEVRDTFEKHGVSFIRALHDTVSVSWRAA